MRRRTTEGRGVRSARVRSQKIALEQRLPVFGFWADLRAPFDRWFASLPLPHVNPDVVSGMSLLLAFLFVAAVYQDMPGVAWVFLAVHLFLDGAGIEIAGRWRKEHERDELLHGQRLDLFVDRAGELLLFSSPVFAWPWLFFFVINTFLTLLSIMKHRSYILPLRQAFLVYYTLTLIF